MTAMKDIRMAIPSGQSVPFVMVPHTIELGVNFGELVVAAGIRIMTVISAMIFKVVPIELKRAIQRVGIDEMQP